jgi:hypothetical protein
MNRADLLEHMVFTWHWWLDVALPSCPDTLADVRDRKNTHESVICGFFHILCATLFAWPE